MVHGVFQKIGRLETQMFRKCAPASEMLSDKVTFQVESFHSGVLKKITKQEGEEVPVKEVVAYIGNEDETVP